MYREQASRGETISSKTDAAPPFPLCAQRVLLQTRQVSLSKMSFAGKYELQTQENFETFMKAIGLPDELIQKGKDIKSVTEIVQNGNHFVITVTTGAKVLHNEFNLGEETELETLTDEKIRSAVNLVDGKLVVKLKAITSVTELSGDLLTNVMTVKDIVYKRVSKRV